MKFILPVLISLAACTAALADITLVRDGKAQAVIIVPEGLSKNVQRPASQLTSAGMGVPLAAVELADYLQKVSGVRPVIATETQNGVEAVSRIYIGHCKANADLAVQPEEFVVRTMGDDLHIRGGDVAPGGQICQGTLYGVYDFIERELGVRWLFPSEHGEVVPRRSTITIPDLDRREQPRIEKRKVRNQAVTREDTFAPVLKQWGVAVEAWKAAQGPEATGAWFRRMRLGARIEIEGGHAYAGWWEKYGKEHPSGSRSSPTARARSSQCASACANRTPHCGMKSRGCASPSSRPIRASAWPRSRRMMAARTNGACAPPAAHSIPPMRRSY